MRMLSLAVFAAVALVVGAYEEDGMTLLIGVGFGARRRRVPAAMAGLRPSSRCCPISSPSRRCSSASPISSRFSAIGRRLTRTMRCPATCRWRRRCSVSSSSPSRIFPSCSRMMAITDPFFAARTPISIRPWPLPPTSCSQSLYARINVFFLILINQFQVAIGVRFNFFHRDFGNAIQVPGRSPSRRVLAPADRTFSRRWSTISILAVLCRVLRSLRTSCCNGGAG